MIEAWERLAPELPPGWSIHVLVAACPEDEEPELVKLTDADGREVCRGTRTMAAMLSWVFFGITRKRYAELTAVERVRAAAEAYCKGRGIAIEGIVYGDHDGHWFHLTFNDCESLAWGKSYPETEDAPTLCDAAWACIEALEGASGATKCRECFRVLHDCAEFCSDKCEEAFRG